MLSKKITIDGFDYELDIEKIPTGYQVTLTPKFIYNANDQGTFKNLSDLRNKLQEWICISHQKWVSDDEKMFFQELHDWGGVINL